MRRRVLLVVLLGSLLLVVVAGWGVTSARSVGTERLRRTLAALEAEGLAPSLEAWLSTLPAVDPALQARAERWLAAAPEVDGYSDTEDEAAYFAGRPPAPAVAAWLEATRASADELSSILRAGRPVLSSVGWAAERARSAPRHARVEVPVRSWLKITSAARRLGLAALDSATRTNATADLDALLASLSHGGFFVDTMSAWGASAARDRSRLRLAVRGDATPAGLGAWADEDAPFDRLYADGVRTGRVLHWLGPLRALAGGASVGSAFPDVATPPDDPIEWWHRRAQPWLHAADDAVLFLEEDAAFERFLRGTGSAEDLLAAERRAQGVGFPFWHGPSPAFSRSQVFGLGSMHAFHRLVRVAALLAAHARESGAVASDAAAARAALGARSRLLDAGPGRFDVALEYERVDADGFRLRVDPSGPPLPLVDAAAWKASCQWPRPASGPTPAIHQTTGFLSVEIRLPPIDR